MTVYRSVLGSTEHETGSQSPSLGELSIHGACDELSQSLSVDFEPTSASSALRTGHARSVSRLRARNRSRSTLPAPKGARNPRNRPCRKAKPRGKPSKTIENQAKTKENQESTIENP